MSNRFVVAMSALGLVAVPLAAQSRPIELGLDGGVAFKVNRPASTTFGLPIQSLRVGLTAGHRIGIEPRVSLLYAKSEGVDAATTFSADLGILFHFKAIDAAGTRAYVRPFAGITHISFVGSATQFHVGAGIGGKFPLKVSRMAMRLEAGLEQGFESDVFDKATSIFALIGFSFFTR